MRGVEYIGQQRKMRSCFAMRSSKALIMSCCKLMVYPETPRLHSGDLLFVNARSRLR